MTRPLRRAMKQRFLLLVVSVGRLLSGFVSGFSVLSRRSLHRREVSTSSARAHHVIIWRGSTATVWPNACDPLYSHGEVGDSYVPGEGSETVAEPQLRAEHSKLRAETREGRDNLKDLALMAEAAAAMPINFRTSPELAYYQLGGDMQTCRVIVGTWQMDGKHGYHPLFSDVRDKIYDAVRVKGYTTWDVAPFYGMAEDWIGRARKQIEDPFELNAYKLFTKLVFPPAVDDLSLAAVEAKVDASLMRLRCARLDLVQLHWWDHSDTRYLDVLQHLDQLKLKGKLRHYGVTNFDATPLWLALDQGFNIVSNQVQLSVIDQRPLGALSKLCSERNVTLLCYGTLLGGLLTERWLDQRQPDPRSFTSLSDEKYFELLRVWGSWDKFQELLHELKAVARRHRSTIEHVAMRWVLDQEAVGSVIVGTRLGYVDHLGDNTALLKLKLEERDRESIMMASQFGRDLHPVMGGVGGEYQRLVQP